MTARMLTGAVVLALFSVAAPYADGSFPGRNGRIVFVSHRAATPAQLDEDGELYTMRADGTGLKRLTANRSFEVLPKWSPRGKRIAFSRYGDGYAVYVMRADGSGVKRVTSPRGANDLFPSWSPDGRRIAFVRQPGNSKGYLAGQILVVGADGKHLRRLPIGPGEYSGLTWSPDGTSFAYMRQLYLYVMRADGSDVRRLLPSLTYVTGFAWSPDGSRIAAAQSLYPRSEIDVVNVDGTGEAVLVPDVAAGSLAWSPDGREIAFNTGGWIAVADIGSGRVRTLDSGEGPGSDSSPDWQARG